MRIVQIETLRLSEYPNLLFVELLTDDGLIGLGETCVGARTVEEHIHETVAPYLLGVDPFPIERHAQALRGYVGYASTGAEMRGNSAVDIALWDLLGQATQQPLYQLLGGASRDDIRVYNTCAGYRYTRTDVEVIKSWNRPEGDHEGPYEDLDAFLTRADELALSLQSEEIHGMKIWPFDPFAVNSQGHYISNADLEIALEPFRKIRAAVGKSIDVMVELHGLWDLPTAKRISHALEEFEPYWIEDPIHIENMRALAQFTASCSTQVAAGETLGGHAVFRDLLELNAADVLTLDIGWVGGISEARRIAAMAEAACVTVGPHDCTGPVVLTASTHLAVHVPNAALQEIVRAFYYGWYPEIVTGLPPIKSGRIMPPAGAGLGTALRPELRADPGTQVRTSTLKAITAAPRSSTSSHAER